MSKLRPTVKATLYRRVRDILETARVGVARSVNTTQVIANWLIGREIIEDEQKGRRRAGYGERLLEELSTRLTGDFGGGYSVQSLRYMRQFYLGFPALLDARPIRHTPCGELPAAAGTAVPEIRHTLCGDLPAPAKNWKPGRLHPNLAWSLYRQLLRVEMPEARAFYEIEAIRNNWSARELERQINSLLFERLARSRDKKGLLKLATRGQQVQGPADIFKDPVVIEFLGLPESHRLVESELEAALLTNLQAFLLELGQGFAFVGRQVRLDLGDQDFYVDLLFYHLKLRCFVVIDLKRGGFKPEYAGKINFYCNVVDDRLRHESDKSTIGLILCQQPNQVLAEYALRGMDKPIGIAGFELTRHLPTELQTSLPSIEAIEQALAGDAGESGDASP